MKLKSALRFRDQDGGREREREIEGECMCVCVFGLIFVQIVEMRIGKSHAKASERTAQT